MKQKELRVVRLIQSARGRVYVEYLMMLSLLIGVGTASSSYISDVNSAYFKRAEDDISRSMRTATERNTGSQVADMSAGDGATSTGTGQSGGASTSNSGGGGAMGDCQKWWDAYAEHGSDQFRDNYEECIANEENTVDGGTGTDVGTGNNGHGNDADVNDDSNPGNSNDPNDYTDDDGAPGGGHGHGLSKK